MNKNIRTKIGWGLLILLLMLSSFALTATNTLDISPVLTKLGLKPVNVAGKPTHSLFRSGHQLLLIYVGSSTCGACLDPDLKTAFAELKPLMVKKANDRRHDITFMGIGKDNDVAAGTEYLTSFGDFDEISIGNGWFNTNMLHFVWDTHPGTPATPQIILVHREIAETGSPQSPAYSIVQEKVVARKVGIGEIQRWIRAGLPMVSLD